jgi:hypothetical protein
MQWRIQRGSTTTITHRIPVQRQPCTTKVRSISGGDVRGGSFFSTQFADRLRNASTSIVGKNTAKVW